MQRSQEGGEGGVTEGMRHTRAGTDRAGSGVGGCVPVATRCRDTAHLGDGLEGLGWIDGPQNAGLHVGARVEMQKLVTRQFEPL